VGERTPIAARLTVDASSDIGGGGSDGRLDGVGSDRFGAGLFSFAIAGGGAPLGEGSLPRSRGESCPCRVSAGSASSPIGPPGSPAFAMAVPHMLQKRASSAFEAPHFWQ